MLPKVALRALGYCELRPRAGATRSQSVNPPGHDDGCGLMLGGYKLTVPRRLRPAPKTSRGGLFPEQRLETLAEALEMAQQRFAERVRTIDDRYLPPHLGKNLSGTMEWSVNELRALGNLWRDARSRGLEMPLLGRLGTVARAYATPKRNPARDLAALHDWLVGNGHAPALLAATSFAPAHTTCSCEVCLEEERHGWTCELVAVCRAVCDLHGRTEFPQKRAVRELLTQRFEVAQALWAIAGYLRKDATVASQLEQLKLAEGLERAQAGENSLEREILYSIFALESIALLVKQECERVLGNHFVTQLHLIPQGRGRPARDRAADQHLERGGLEIRVEGSSARVQRRSGERARVATRKDQRQRFIRGSAPIEMADLN